MRMAQALLDDSYRDEADFINAMAEDFRRKLAADPMSNRISWRAGVEFYNQIMQHARLPGRAPACLNGWHLTKNA